MHYTIWSRLSAAKWTFKLISALLFAFLMLGLNNSAFAQAPTITAVYMPSPLFVGEPVIIIGTNFG